MKGVSSRRLVIDTLSVKMTIQMFVITKRALERIREHFNQVQPTVKPDSFIRNNSCAL